MFNSFPAHLLARPTSSMNRLRSSPNQMNTQGNQMNVPSNQMNGQSNQMNTEGQNQISTGNGASQGSGSPARIMPPQEDQLQFNIQAFVSDADEKCKGRTPDFVIPIGRGNKFVVCIDEGKGVVQDCPKGLYYNTDNNRCEHKIGAINNPCAPQTCNGAGQCIVIDSTSFRCECAPGFGGQTCELDARVCQTQQPCGQSPDTKCQSFHWGSALQYVCVLQGGLAYGLKTQQVHANPCGGGETILPLAFSDKGFIMCDGEQMFIQSCPGGTVWNDLKKTCVWPDTPTVVTAVAVSDQKGQNGNGQQQAMLNQPTGNGAQ